MSELTTGDVRVLARGMADEVSLHSDANDDSALAACAPVLAGYAVALAGALTVIVTVREVYGRPAVYPANDTARTFATIARQTTLTAETMRGIRALGYAVEVQAGTLPAGY